MTFSIIKASSFPCELTLYITYGDCDQIKEQYVVTKYSTMATKGKCISSELSCLNYWQYKYH